MTGSGASVLIPVDFSPKGILSVKVGFELARRLNTNVCLIHASVFPDPAIVPQFPEDFNGMDNENVEIEEAEISEEVHEQDLHSMEIIKKKIKELQKSGDLPDLSFKSVIAPGMPEEVISEYCNENPPSVVVMATRGLSKRMEELVGSVTAEVIDHCVAPVMTVPEDYTFNGFKEIVRICVFCNFDEGDYESVSHLMKMFDNPEVKIYLFPANNKIKNKDKVVTLENLQSRLKMDFPNSEFLIGYNGDGNLRIEAEKFFIQESIQMILAPNHKRNALSRFFNPGLAHKILYEIDFPMLAIPVS